MKNASKFFQSHHSTPKFPNILHTHCSLSTRSKSSTKRPSHKPSAYQNTRPKKSPPSLYQNISRVLGTEDPAFSHPVIQHGIQTACQIAQKTANSSEPMSTKEESKKTHVGDSIAEDVSPMVHRITAILRSENTGIQMEQQLEELGFSFSSEIVEKVLKRCFKVGHLALRFFNWVKLQPGFSHTTETYNAMIYIAGEAKEFDLVEKLASEMDAGLCLKNTKTWTIIISHYGKAMRIGRALSTFDEMRKSGCKLDNGVYVALLRALVNAGKTELALEFYKEMVFRNMEVDMNLYELLMNCLSRSGDIEAVRSVGDDMMKIAKVSESEVFILMLRSFCVSGKIDEARELFDEIKKKNLSVDPKIYEVLVKGLCRASRMDEAIQIVDKMKQNSASDDTLYGCLINGYLRSGNIPKALELLDQMRASGYTLAVSSCTQMIQHLFRSDNYTKACEVYDEMIGDGAVPDIVAVTAMIAGHVQHDCISEAWRVFENMKEKGMTPTWKAYSVFIKELCKASRPVEALKLLIEMADCNINPTDDVFRLVISSLSRNGELEKASAVEKMAKSFNISNNIQVDKVQLYRSLSNQPLHKEHEVSNGLLNSIQTPKEFSDSDLNELCNMLSFSADWTSTQEVLERSTIHFTPGLVTAVLNSCQRHGRTALRFFHWVGNKVGYRHTTDTYNMAIKISGSAKDFKHMRNLYQEMRRRGCSVTPNTWTIMIAQYGQAGLTEIALKAFKEMKSDSYQPNASTFKYLLVFLCGNKGRKVDEAIKIFHAMMHSGFMPDKETVEIYLSALCESRKIIDARRSVKSLVKRGFTKQLCYSLLVKALCRAGKLKEALVLVNEMKHLGCSVDQFIYGSVVHALLRRRRLDEALEKVDAMKKAGISLSTHIQTSLIVHFCKEKQMEKAVEVFRKMREDGCEPTVVTYSAMIRGYMNMGMVAEAWDVFRRMKVKGPFPDFETYSMFMTCLCKTGRSEDGLELIYDMLESDIIPSAVNFRTVFHGLNREGKQDLAQSVLKTKWNLKRERSLLD